MKEKITFPDWTRLAGQIITRNGETGSAPFGGHTIRTRRATSSPSV